MKSFSVPMSPLTNWSIGTTKELNHNKIKKVKFFNEQKLVYKTRHESIHLLDSTCPHRGADLSKGKIVNDYIQCPYHGWEFDSSGILRKVPSNTFEALPKNCILESNNIISAGGFMWYSENENIIPCDYCPELYSPEWMKIYGSKELKGSFIDWIMNGTDISHINFVHSFANEENGSVSNVEVISNEQRDVIDCYANVQPKAASVLTEHMQPSTVGSTIHSKFIYPNTVITRIKLKDPYEFITFTTLIPIDDKNTKMSWCLLYPKTPLMSLPFIQNRFYEQMYKTVSEDEDIISRLKPVKLPYEINVKCDKYQLEVLKFLDTNNP